MLMFDMLGQCCGAIDDANVPEGYWARPDDAPTSMAPLDFLDKIGPEGFAVIWNAAITNPALAFQMMRGFAAQTILIEESFPALMAMEAAGLLPGGTALAIWTFD